MNSILEEPKSQIDIITENNEPEHNYNVIEESYTDKSESLLKYWLKTAEAKRDAHNIKGKSFKFKHEITALPAALLPIIYSPISGLLDDSQGVKVANVSVLITTGILSGVHSFFDFGRKSQKHFEYEAKYSDLVTTILVELSKKREIRIRCDRFLEMIQAKIDNYGANEPLL